MKMELRGVRFESMVRVIRLRIELIGGLLQTPRFWLHPIILD
jgi:hypothetical protein